MSLEQALTENTAAVNELKALMTEEMALRRVGIDVVRDAAASTTTTKKPTAAEKKAAAEKAETPPADKAEPEKSADPADPADPAAPTSADVNAVIALYVSGSPRPEEVDARKKKLKELIVFACRDTDIKNPKSGDIPAKKYAAFIKKVNEFIAEGDLTEAAPAEDDGGL